MTLTQLKYILAVERCQGFVQAARECHITQPTLSMQVQKLEDYLQLVIFDRAVSPVRPTAEGKRILEMAREVVHRADALEEAARGARQEVAGEFRLGVIPTLAPYLLPLFMADFAKRCPRVRLHVYEFQTDEIMERLREDKLDAGLLATPLEAKDLREEPLFYEPFSLLFSPGHQLLKQEAVREEDLSLDEAWLLKEGHCLRAQALQLCQAGTSADRPVSFEGGSLETLVRLVEEGRGFTVLPELAAQRLGAPEKKRLRPWKGKRPVREISLVTGPFALRHAIQRALKDCLISHLPAELQKKNRGDKLVELGP